MNTAIIHYEKGLHARVAAMVVQKAFELEEKYTTTLYIQFKKCEKIPATSLMPLIHLKIKQFDEVNIMANGGTADMATQEFIEFLESDFHIDTKFINCVDNLIQDNSLTMEHVFTNMENGLIICDAHDIITVFNPMAEKITEIPAEKAIGKNAYSIIPEARLHIVRQTGKAEIGCRQLIGKSIVIINRNPILVNDEIKGAVAIFEDVSILEKTTGQLREVKELQERLQVILESVHDGICVTDKDGNITYVNPAYRQILSVKRDEIVGKNITQISPKGARTHCLQHQKKVVGVLSKKTNGAVVMADVSPIVVEKEFSGTVSIVKNITEVQVFMQKVNELSEKTEYLEQELWRTKKPDQAFNKFIGQNGKVMDALAIASKAAKTQATVLIVGKSGTGKEVVAEGIHYASPRAAMPFIRVNCAAIPENLLESELFGHERGAFTGAFRKKLGKFEMANKGTIFLDEIGEMEKGMQAKLLRVLQLQEFERVGGEETIKVDVRVIAATNRNLETMVKSGEFREDLYYRLNVIPIFLPPLKERREDIPLLVEHFFAKYNSTIDNKLKGIHPKVMKELMAYSWPGNVRELSNILERIVTLADGPWIEQEDLPAYLKQEVCDDKEVLAHALKQTEVLPLEKYEKLIIETAVSKCGNFSAAAKALGVTQKTVAAKAKKYELQE